jgi:hypothetical protein
MVIEEALILARRLWQCKLHRLKSASGVKPGKQHSHMDEADKEDACVKNDVPGKWKRLNSSVCNLMGLMSCEAR